jgi:hypothetical protein
MLLLYQFAYGVSANIIFDISNIKIIVVWKYVDIVVNVLIDIYLYISWSIDYLRYWEDFLMHLIYPIFVMPLIGHIFYFIKRWISELL